VQDFGVENIIAYSWVHTALLLCAWSCGSLRNLSSYP